MSRFRSWVLLLLGLLVFVPSTQVFTMQRLMGFCVLLGIGLLFLCWESEGSR